MNKLFKLFFDLIFGSRLVRTIVLIIFGHSWNGWFLGFIRYRAIYMVEPGETCIIAGIYNETTIADFSRAVGKSGHVIVVEANPLNVERLKTQIKSENVSITNKAIWNEPGELDFILSDQEKNQGYPCHRIVSIATRYHQILRLPLSHRLI